MNCQDIKNIFSEYISGALSPEVKTVVDSHVSKCGSCRKELAVHKAMLEGFKSLDKVKAPPDFLDKVHEKINERADFESIMRTLFTPVKIKVPVAVFLALVIGIFVFKTTPLLLRYSRTPFAFQETAMDKIDLKKSAPQTAEKDFREEKESLPTRKIQTYTDNFDSSGSIVSEKAVLANEQISQPAAINKAESRAADNIALSAAGKVYDPKLSAIKEITKSLKGKITTICRNPKENKLVYLIIDIPENNYKEFIIKFNNLSLSNASIQNVDVPKPGLARILVKF